MKITNTAQVRHMMKASMVLGADRHDGVRTDGAFFVKEAEGEYIRLYFVHNNPRRNGNQPDIMPEGYSCSWYLCCWAVGQHKELATSGDDYSDIVALSVRARSVGKREVHVNHQRLLSAIGVAKKDTLLCDKSRLACDTIRKAILLNKSLLVAVSSADKTRFSIYIKTENKATERKRTVTTLARICRRYLNITQEDVADHVLAVACGAILNAMSPFDVRLLTGKDIQSAYVACNDISGLRSCMTHHREMTALYAENPEKVSLLTVMAKGGGLDTLIARALVFTTDSGRRMLSRVYSTSGCAGTSAVELWREQNKIDRCHGDDSDEDGEELTLTMPENNFMPYMDSFRRYDDSANPGDSVTFKEDGRYCASTTDGTHSGSIRCSRCDNLTAEDESYSTHDGDTICQSCYENHYGRCERCGDVYEDEELVEVDEDYYCRDCAPGYVTCSYCGDNISVDSGDYVRVGDEFWCDHHAPSHETCVKCGENERDENMVEVDGEFYCHGCAPEHRQCEECEKLTTDCVLIDNVFLCEECAEKHESNKKEAA